MKYQVIIAGFGGQGAVFLVKVLSIAANIKGVKCLGTENHGMSQRGGSVSCYVKLGDFHAPAIDENQGDLLIGLEKDEALRNIQFLNRKNGKIVVNSEQGFPDNGYDVTAIDAFKSAKDGDFPIQGLNVYMLGITLASDKNFPFTQEEIEKALVAMNEKLAPKNIEVLRLAISRA